jgi:hypothetical protein
VTDITLVPDALIVLSLAAAAAAVVVVVVVLLLLLCLIVELESGQMHCLLSTELRASRTSFFYRSHFPTEIIGNLFHLTFLPSFAFVDDLL